MLAAALKAVAPLLVTDSIRDFPTTAIRGDLRVLSPDEFVLLLVGEDVDSVVEVIELQAAALRNPPMTVSDLLDGLEHGFDAGSVAGFTELWTATVDDVAPRGLGPPVVSFGEGIRVHVTSGRTVYTYNASTGSLLWSSVPDTLTPTIEEVDTEAFVYRDFLITSVRTSGVSWEVAQCGLTTDGCDTLGGEVPGRAEALRVTGPDVGQLILLLSHFGPSSHSAQAYFGGGERAFFSPISRALPASRRAVPRCSMPG